MDQFLLKNSGAFELVFAEPQSQIEINLNDFAAGIHEKDNFFFKLNEQAQVEWVISSICDHANGKLIKNKQCENLARCPLHGWELDLQALEYTNVAVKKQKIPFKQLNNFLYIDNARAQLALPKNILTKKPSLVSIRFLAHACLAIDIDGFTIITDPWLMGPCFLTGWWHKLVPKADALDILMNADLIYISHNHPDHMHLETLHYVKNKRPDIPIIVPNFDTHSTAKPLRSFGFGNVHELLFNNLYTPDDKSFVLSILKSGDFRDDSGLFISAGGFSALLTVDSASLNRMVLPKNLSFMATAFAGGASGYPLCFEDYSLTEKKVIGQRNRIAARKLAMDYIEIVEPKTYMPYAGYFSEEAPRDYFIKENNQKNQVEEIRLSVEKHFPETFFIDPRKSDVVYYDGEGRFIRSDLVREDQLFLIDEDYINSYIKKEEVMSENFNLQDIVSYFEASNFQDNLLLYLIPTVDDFEPLKEGLLVDFSSDKPRARIDSVMNLLESYKNKSEQKKKLIRVRKNSLWGVVSQKLPWEDMSIGFQCRVERKPNIYNSRFWYHFTNIYIGEACE